MVDLAGQPCVTGAEPDDPEQAVVVGGGARDVVAVQRTHDVDLLGGEVVVVGAQRGQPARALADQPGQQAVVLGQGAGGARVEHGVHLAGHPGAVPAEVAGADDLVGHPGVDVGERGAEGLPGPLGGQDLQLAAAQRVVDLDAVLGETAEQDVGGAVVVVEVEDALAPVETVPDVGGGELPEVLGAVRDRAHVIPGRQRVRQLDHVSPAAPAPPPLLAAPGTPRHELLDGSTVRRPSAEARDLGACEAPNRR